MAAVAGRVAKSMTKSGLDSARAAAASKTGPRLAWEEFNYPCGREPLNIIHFDLAELADKCGSDAYTLVRILYSWWIFTLGLVLLNFINSAILVAEVDNSKIYPGTNVAYSVFNIAIALIAGLFAVYHAYHGVGAKSLRSRRYALALFVVFFVLTLVLAFGDFGNVNGFANLSSDRLRDTKDSGKDAIHSFWVAMSVIEGLCWLVNCGILSFGTFKLFRMRF